MSAKISLQNVKSFEHSSNVFILESLLRTVAIVVALELARPINAPPPVRIAVPPAIPNPPAAREPPPTKAKLALVNAAPDNPATLSPAIAIAIWGANSNPKPPVINVIVVVADAPIIILFVLFCKTFLL